MIASRGWVLEEAGLEVALLAGLREVGGGQEDLGWRAGCGRGEGSSALKTSTFQSREELRSLAGFGCEMIGQPSASVPPSTGGAQRVERGFLGSKALARLDQVR